MLLLLLSVAVVVAVGCSTRFYHLLMSIGFQLGSMISICRDDKMSAVCRSYSLDVFVRAYVCVCVIYRGNCIFGHGSWDEDFICDIGPSIKDVVHGHGLPVGEAI